MFDELNYSKMDVSVCLNKNIRSLKASLRMHRLKKMAIRQRSRYSEEDFMYGWTTISIDFKKLGIFF